MGKTIKEKLKEAEKYICENFDELGIDDPRVFDTLFS